MTKKIIFNPNSEEEVTENWKNFVGKMFPVKALVTFGIFSPSLICVTSLIEFLVIYKKTLKRSNSTSKK